MPPGRCAGCGQTGPQRRVAQHVLDCAQYLRLYRSTPDACLEPAAEYRRHRDQQASAPVRAQRRDNVLQRRYTQLDRLHDLQTRRRHTGDITVDD